MPILRTFCRLLTVETISSFPMNIVSWEQWITPDKKAHFNLWLEIYSRCLCWLVVVTVGAECWAGGWWCQSLEMRSVLYYIILIILSTTHSHTATTPQPTPPTTPTAAERRRVWIIMITLLAIAGVLGSSLGSVEAANSVTIDLSKARLDEESGNYCVIQKVTIENLILCCLSEMLKGLLWAPWPTLCIEADIINLWILPQLIQWTQWICEHVSGPNWQTKRV